MKTLIAIAVAFLVLSSTATALDDMQTTDPEQIAFRPSASNASTRLWTSTSPTVIFPGPSVLIARRGKIGYFKAWGDMTKRPGRRCPRARIFRMYSMTKAITGVAAMILYEQGHFSLNDPISNYLPEFKNMTVAVDRSVPVPAENQITVRDPVHAHRRAELRGRQGSRRRGILAKTGVSEAKTLDEMVKRIAKAPLVQQPGTTWQYGYSTDVLARYVEAVSGVPVDEFFSKNIFRPLGMGDTGYYVPKDKLDRLTVLYTLDKGKRRCTARQRAPR